ncbi:MAG: hypothetical protein K6E91_07745 [Butyrivibrio sp.]|nr:hypothetical protein [Butyrivibrio sp.]
MIVVIISWIYIFLISITIGLGVNRALSRLIPVPAVSESGITGLCVTGITTLTVYAEVFSIFYKVGALCHILVPAAAVIIGFKMRGELGEIILNLRREIRGNRLVVLVLIVLAGAFFTSRGTFHTDTGIYHAQAIRLLEEYGVLKGLGNLQLHFAYNSAYLSLCALFTLSFILPFALHTMTGFFMVVFSVYAAFGLFGFAEHRRHGGDFARIALLIYSVTNLTGLQSPATDYGTMFFSLYILVEWISWAEEKSTGDKIRDIAEYGYLSVLSIFVVSMKLSAALLVVLAVLPAVMLVQKKMWKELVSFLLIGFLSFLPYLVRNVIISGWLFYPVAAIDLFDVVWKIPAEYMKVDSDQIKVWGRCLYDITKVDEGITTWLPVWWEERRHYEEMLIYSQFVAALLLGATAVTRAVKKELNGAVCVFYLAVVINIAMWFLTAPFIRYGLAFLLIFPLCAVGDALDVIIGKKSVILGLAALLIAVNFGSWIDNYFTDDMVFVKHYIMSGNYVTPVPFDNPQMSAMDMNGLTVYVAGLDEINSYYTCPGTCYDFMAERTELIGKDIYSGFKPKEK